MAIRRLNYTGRKKIARSDAQIGITRGGAEGQAATFVADLHFKDYSFPTDASVVIEAYRQTSLMRFDYGTVAFPHEVDPLILRQFDVVEAVKFRVKVLAGDGSGRLLGVADQIAPIDMDAEMASREGLLPVKPDDIGHQLWWLEFDQAGPVLIISKRTGDWKGFARTPHFQWLVLPAVLRLILERIVELGGEDEGDDDGWEQRWLRFVKSLPGIPSSVPLGAPETIQEQWIDDVCRAFAKRSRYVEKFTEALFAEPVE